MSSPRIGFLVFVGVSVACVSGVILEQAKPPTPPVPPTGWEQVSDDLHRIKVSGGWLYRCNYRYAVSLSFVPDAPPKEF